jgi:hypothetical protein
MTDTETFETISHPSRLKEGERLMRFMGINELCECRVIAYEKPKPPRAGEAWSSGFLAVEWLEGDSKGQVSRIGPCGVITRDFRRIVPARVEDDADGDAPQPNSPQRRFWWNED